MKRLAYLLVATVLFGAQFLAIPLGVAQLSAYRFMIALSIGTLLYRIIIGDPDLEISIGQKGRFTSYQLFYLFWLIYAGISIIWAENLSRWAVGMFFVGCGVFSILFISYFIQEKHDIKNLFKIFFIITIFHHIAGWVESLSVVFPKTTFGNQNDFATMLLAGLFVGLLIFMNTKKRWCKFLLILYFISGFLLIQVTGSRGNTLALLVGLSVLISMKFLDYRMFRSIFYLFVSAAILFILSLVLIPAFREVVADGLEWLISGPLIPYASNRNRINMILNGFYFLLKSFGLGVGAGNVEHYLMNEAILYVDAPNIHNWFMDILVGYGIIVFALYIIMYIYILRRLFLNYFYSKDSFIKNTSLVLFSYIVAFVISSMSSATNIIIEWQWVFWGMIIAFVQYTERYDLRVTQSEPLETNQPEI
jgi:teichuronic acid biosynthesis protein TuaE